MLRVILSGIVLAILAGCASAPVVQKGTTIEQEEGKTVTTKSDYAVYLEKASEQQPLFELTCPPAGCVLTGLKVHNPNQTTYAPPAVEQSWGMAFTNGMFSLASDALRIGVPWIAGARVLEKAFDKANASVTTSTSNLNAPTTTNLSTTTNTSNTTSNTTNTTSSTSSTNTMTNTNSNSNTNTNGK